MEVVDDDDRSPAHLEVLFCSSEDTHFPATNLTRRPCLFGTAGLSPGWEAEKFCEFPQELVFRINRGLPTRIAQVNLTSHPSKIATWVEIFTSTPANDKETVVAFERLGFVRFLSSEDAQFTAFQTVQSGRATAQTTLLRLVVHSCHQAKANFFSQVGLVAVAVLGPRPTSTFVLPTLASPVHSPSKSSNHLFTSSLSPLRVKYELKQLSSPSVRQRDGSSPVRGRATFGTGTKSPLAVEVWVPEAQEHKTLEQISAHIQIGKQLALFASDEKLAKPWIALDREAGALISRYQDAVETQDLEGLVHNFADLERRRHHQETLLHQQIRGIPDVTSRLRSEHWQDREKILRQLAESLQVSSSSGDNSEAQPDPRLPVTDEDALEIVIAALNDSHDHVFVAACALLQTLLTTQRGFQDLLTGKSDITKVLESLVARLDDRDMAVRNIAAFSILKVAGSTRTRGTFVMHVLLKHVEQPRFQPSDQQLVALLNLFAALLLSFHCCARIDIAPKRVLQFLQRSDADLHENALVREASKQLTLAVCSEVGAEFVIQNHVSKLPEEQQRRYAPLLRRMERSDSN